MDGRVEEVKAAVEKRMEQNRLRDFEKYHALFTVVEQFVRKKGLLLYGGLAINSTLPVSLRFYDENELPDYDMFSPRAYEDAKQLADEYHALGYQYIEAKPGVHEGTYKVYVDFQPVADITDVPRRLFARMRRISVSERPLTKKHNPLFDLDVAPLDFLRMAFHLELSRPDGDISRWPKVYDRMVRFYKVYPLLAHATTADSDASSSSSSTAKHSSVTNSLIDTILSVLSLPKYVDVPIGGTYVLSRRLKHTRLPKAAALECIAEDPAALAKDMADAIQKVNRTIVTRKTRAPLNRSELLPGHVTLSVDETVVAIVYKANACYSAEKDTTLGINRPILSVDSQLCIWLAAQLSQRSYYPVKPIRRLINYLIEWRMKKKTLPSIDRCYGHQPQLADIRREKWDAPKKGKSQVYRPA